jgi:uncharacterized protein YdhG (YjbR/CyaY superfamily)
MKPFKDVGEYIASMPTQTQPMLQQVRQIIKENAPEAEEKISYGMPYYGYHGRLIYFGGFKTHVGLYVMSNAREALAKEIKPYQISLATLHFPLDQPLPAELIKKIVTAQVKANELK